MREATPRGDVPRRVPDAKPRIIVLDPNDPMFVQTALRTAWQALVERALRAGGDDLETRDVIETSDDGRAATVVHTLLTLLSPGDLPAILGGGEVGIPAAVAEACKEVVFNELEDAVGELDVAVHARARVLREGSDKPDAIARHRCLILRQQLAGMMHRAGMGCFHTSDHELLEKLWAAREGDGAALRCTVLEYIDAAAEEGAVAPRWNELLRDYPHWDKPHAQELFAATVARWGDKEGGSGTQRGKWGQALRFFQLLGIADPTDDPNAGLRKKKTERAEKALKKAWMDHCKRRRR